MRRLLVVASALLLAASLTGCGASGSNVGTTADQGHPALSDGEVSYDEYQAAFRAYSSCLEDAGYKLVVHAEENQTIQFSVTATGTAPLAYQWLRNDVVFPGKTDAALAFTTTTTNDIASLAHSIATVSGQPAFCASSWPSWKNFSATRYISGSGLLWWLASPPRCRCRRPAR